MIGTSIFLVPSIMLRHVGRPTVVIGVWIFAGILSLSGALGYAELGGAIPETGGEYVYLRRAYGRMTGFVYGWTQFVVAKSASVAAIATAFMLYLTYFFPGLSSAIWTWQDSIAGRTFTLRLTGLQLGATLMVLLVSGLNILGVRRSGAVQTVFTFSKLGVLAVLIVLGLVLGHGSFSHFYQSVPHDARENFFAGAGVATVSALWAYDGWNNLSMVSGEVKIRSAICPGPSFWARFWWPSSIFWPISPISTSWPQVTPQVPRPSPPTQRGGSWAVPEARSSPSEC